MLNKKYFILLLIILFICSVSFISAEVYEVTNGDELQAALISSFTSSEDDIILMDAGVYYRTYEGVNYADFFYYFEFSGSVTIRGADGTTAESVVIDAFGNGPCMDLFGSYLLRDDSWPNFEISGITFQNADYEGHPALAVQFLGNNLTVKDCIFKNNNHVFSFNNGGRMIKGNNVYFINNKIINNNFVGGGGGSGVYICAAENLVIKNNIIANNISVPSVISPDVKGGGLYVEYTNDSNNPAYLINNTIYGNESDKGGGIYLEGSNNAEFILYNNIIYNNRANITGGGNDIYSDTVDSSIRLYNNNYSDIVFYGIIEESINNLDTDPCFISTVDGDFRLAAGSPMIDAGTDVIPVPPGLPEFDYEGGPRIEGADPDIGADEYTSVPYVQMPLRARWIPDIEFKCPLINIKYLDELKMQALISNDIKKNEIEIWVVQVSEQDTKYYTKDNKWTDKKTVFQRGFIDEEYIIEITEYSISKTGSYDFYIIADSTADGKMTPGSTVLDSETLIISDK